MNELNDAEVLGDSKAVRRITSLLKNRRALPAKLFQFHENARPAYYGMSAHIPAFRLTSIIMGGRHLDQILA